MLPLCADQNLGYTPFSPLAGGFLTGKYKFDQNYPEGSRMTLRPEPYLAWWNEKTFAQLDQFRAAAQDKGVSMAGLALAWQLHHPQIAASIIGPRRPDHFTPVKEALNLTLTANELLEISAIFD